MDPQPPNGQSHSGVEIRTAETCIRRAKGQSQRLEDIVGLLIISRYANFLSFDLPPHSEASSVSGFSSPGRRSEDGAMVSNALSPLGPTSSGPVGIVALRSAGDNAVVVTDCEFVS